MNEPTAARCASMPGPISYANQLHLIGRIQSFGFLLAIDQAHRIRHVSGNSISWLHRPAHAVAGRLVGEVLPDQVVQAFGLGSATGARRPAASTTTLRWRVGTHAGQDVDVDEYASGELRIFEFEPQPPTRAGLELASAALSVTSRIPRAQTLDELLPATAAVVSDITGFERVMIHRFLPDGSAMVEAEHTPDGSTRFLRYRFPAEDLPPQKRALYAGQPLRYIVDAQDPGVEIVGCDDDPLDLSLCTTRAAAPEHLQYMRNMGALSSLSIALMVEGEMWGMVTCHHPQPTRLHRSRRLLARMVAALCSSAISRLSRERRERLAAQTTRETARLAALFGGDRSPPVLGFLSELCAELDSVGCLWLGPEDSLATGLTPRAPVVDQLLEIMRAEGSSEVFSCDSILLSLGVSEADCTGLAGLLAIRLTSQPLRCLAFFRAEHTAREVWAGNPDPQRSHGDTPQPRRSFEAWVRISRHRSRGWSRDDVLVARQLRAQLLDACLKHQSDRQLSALSKLTEHQQLLIGELNHRVRNLLGLLGGIVARVGQQAPTVEAYGQALQVRIASLARAYTRVEKGAWQNVGWHGLLADEVAAVGRASQLRIEGADLLLTADACLSLALVVHELTTNACKYGALSAAGGLLTVRREPKQEDGYTTLTWVETGGPPARTPSRRGFGSEVIEKAIVHELGGTVDTAYLAEGLRLRIKVPQRHWVPTADSKPTPTLDVAADVPWSAPPGRVLVVEDDFVIALAAEAMLSSLGFEGSVIVGSASEALLQIERQPFALALIDIHLGDHKSEGVAIKLRAEGIPFIVTSGYSDLTGFSDAYDAAAGRVLKPYGPDDLLPVLRRLFIDQKSA